MSKYRRAAKVDSNQAEIVKALRVVPGVTVALRHDDILVGYRGRTYWYEIKTGQRAEIKAGQAMLCHTWTGHYRIVSTAHAILVDIGIEQKNLNT
jgi:hypothetical protein